MFKIIITDDDNGNINLEYLDDLTMKKIDASLTDLQDPNGAGMYAKMVEIVVQNSKENFRNVVAKIDSDNPKEY